MHKSQQSWLRVCCRHLSGSLWDEFGAKRVIDTPISETAIMGAAAGAALSGLGQ